MPGSFRSVRTRSTCSFAGASRPVSASGGGTGVEAGFAEIEFEQAAHVGFVFDDENVGMIFREAEW